MSFTVTQINKNVDYKKLILPGFIVLMLLHLIFTFSGFYGNDDILYAGYAADIAYQGISLQPATDHYQLRWTPIYFTAFFYRIFGINPFTSAIFSAVSFAICGFILHKIMRHKKTALYLLVMSLFFLAHSVIFYMHRLLPDAGICLAVLWMYYAYRSFYENTHKPLLHAVHFAAALLFAVVTKESIIIVLPLFILIFLKDLFKRKNLSFWKYAIVFSVVFVFLYLLFFKITTNDFLFRYQLLLSKKYETLCSYDTLPFIHTLKRISYKLWQAMLLNGDFLVFLPGLAAAVYKNKILYTGIRKLDIFSFLFLLFCANFMTTSITAYAPLCPDPRHYIFLMPFAAITGGPMLYAFFKEPEKFPVLPLLFGAATAVMFMMHAGATKYLYLACTLLFSGVYLTTIISRKKILFKISAAIFIAIFFINYLNAFIKPLYPVYWDHKQVIENTFSGKKISATVFSTKNCSIHLSKYFLKFKTGELHFFYTDSIKTYNAGQLYYMLNAGFNASAKNSIDSLINLKTDRQIFLAEHSNKIFLYRVDNAFLQMIKEK